jgi:choline dehydrogenase
MAGTPDADCDYVVVGSGAGGGTVAARLAEAGWHVVLLEAGGDARQANAAALPEHYDVPAFHPLASEHPAMRWDFFVRHYADDARQRRDPKCTDRGIYYPRAGTLGGCTAHNAMIFVAPHDSDWNGIADLTGDSSWRAAKMRRYLRRLENCRSQPFWRLLSQLGLNITGRGWSGWLDVESARPREALWDDELVHLILSSARSIVLAARHPLRSLRILLLGEGDPNSRLPGQGSFEGVCFTPLSTRLHQRRGARERVLEVVACHPDLLEVRLHALATRVIFDEDNRATGVEYLEGEHLYGADPAQSPAAGTTRQVSARNEVIVAGGTFNSPQLLKLSGIGPAEELRSIGIPLRVDLAGVGSNLQDRSERDDLANDDLRAVVEGINLARGLTDALNDFSPVAEEVTPGRRIHGDQELRSFVRDNAWGHHACGTCAIGPRDRDGVVDSRFRVHGTRGLRVVDASIFPRIPGFFIVSAVYIIAEKAADDILSEAKRTRRT